MFGIEWHSHETLAQLLSAVTLLVSWVIVQQTLPPENRVAVMPSDQAKKMRACEKRAIQQQIKMEDRSRFVTECTAGKT